MTADSGSRLGRCLADLVQPPTTRLGERVMPGLAGAAHRPEKVPRTPTGQDHFQEAGWPRPAIRSLAQEDRVRHVTVPIGHEPQQLEQEGIEGR